MSKSFSEGLYLDEMALVSPAGAGYHPPCAVPRLVRDGILEGPEVRWANVGEPRGATDWVAIVGRVRLEVAGAGRRWEWTAWDDSDPPKEIARSGDPGTNAPRWYRSGSAARRGAERWLLRKGMR